MCIVCVVVLNLFFAVIQCGVEYIRIGTHSRETGEAVSRGFVLEIRMVGRFTS